MLNIKSKAVSETGVLELLDADDEPLIDDKGNRCSITLYSPGSKAFGEADAERQNRIMVLMASRPGKMKLSAEERRQMDAQFCARITASFNHFDYPTDEKLTGFEMFKAAYLDREIGFILSQVDKFIGDWGNFKTGSAKA